MPPKTKNTKDKRLISDTIRKPTAPPTQTFGSGKPEEKAHPAARKVKYKKKLDPVD